MSHKIRVSSRSIIIQDNKILLICFGNGLYYNFPGGGIEKHETAKQAVVREVLEESGLTVDVGELVFSLEYEPFNCGYSYGDGHHISFFFRCYVNNSIAPAEPSHTDVSPDDESITSAAEWVSLSELHTVNFIPPIYDSLMKYIETGVFSPSYWAEDAHLEK